MNPSELRARTLTFAVSVHGFVKPLLLQPDTRHVAMQLFRASSSVACNYRAAGLGRSKKEFIAKIGTVAEEADESLFWLSFLGKSQMVPSRSQSEFASLSREAQALVKIFVASYRTAKRRLREEQARKRNDAANPAAPATQSLSAPTPR